MDLKAPGHILELSLLSWTTRTPSKIREYLWEAAGTVLGMSRRPPQAHARVKSPGQQARSEGTRQRLLSWRMGVFLWGEGSLEPRPSDPSPLLPPGDVGLESGPAASGDALTCFAAAGTRAESARPPPLQSSPRQPPPPAWHHVDPGSQSQDSTCAEHPGTKGVPQVPGLSKKVWAFASGCGCKLLDRVTRSPRHNFLLVRFHKYCAWCCAWLWGCAWLDRCQSVTSRSSGKKQNWQEIIVKCLL